MIVSSPRQPEPRDRLPRTSLIAPGADRGLAVHHVLRPLRQLGRRPAALGILLVIAALVVPTAVVAAPRPTAAATADPGDKLRGGLDALVADPSLLDPRLGTLVAGYRPGEIAYFALLSEPNDRAHRRALVAQGARILRSYRSVEMVALASPPAAVLAVASLPWVTWLTPVEVVVAAEHEQEVDQSDPPVGTPVDVGAPALWARGATGEGIRIAILDTGMDLTHQDLDDLDFRHWGNPPNTPTVNPLKVVDARNFNGGGCAAPGSGGFDAHGHGTHVAGIAAGTGEGDPSTNADDGRVTGIAPDAQLAVGKVLTDAGAGINSDLITAIEWAAMPPGEGNPACPSIGAHIVNTSLGSDARPGRLNTGHDVDAVSHVLDRLATRFGTIFVSAAGNSGPYIGSVLEAPGSAAQALSIGATAKDWDVNHDETQSGDTCAGYRHPVSPPDPNDNECDQGPGTQRPSLSTFSSRGGAEGKFQKPDLVAPGYNIVSAQSAHGAALAQNDLNTGTREDPFYATATGTSMASPAAAGMAALLLDAYRDRYGALPKGSGGLPGVKAPRYALVRAALMNTARSGLAESRWILKTDEATQEAAGDCPPTPDPIIPILCDFAEIITGATLGPLTLMDVRNGPGDTYPGPLGEGAGKAQPVAALRALARGIVIYSAANRPDAITEPGHQDFQGSWQTGVLTPGTTEGDRFVLRSAPDAPTLTARFSFRPGHPSDSTRAIPTSGPGAWTVGLPGATTVAGGSSRAVTFTVRAPSGTPAGVYTGEVIVALSNGDRLRVPVLASIPLHDRQGSAGNVAGPQARFDSARDVFAKGDTVWPSAAGAALGAMADWIIFPVELAPALDVARFTVHDAADGDETYDLYLYSRSYRLIASTHPFAAEGVTDTTANDARGPTPASAPQILEIEDPAAGRYYVVVNRAKVGTVDAIGGDFGAYVLTLDEVAAAP